MSPSLFHTFAMVVALAALFSYVNHKFLKLPTTIGLMLLALGFAGIMIVIGFWNKDFLVQTCQVVSVIDFREILMDIMLSFLLFAGALHVNAKALKLERMSVFLFATMGVVISTFLVGSFIFWIAGAFGVAIPYTYCLLFGALISPTDPIAVLAILKNSNVSRSLETKISGESLFNDGVGVVVFVTILMLNEKGIEKFDIVETIEIFAEEALGGLVYGAVIGFLGLYILKSISDEPKIEVLISIAITMGGYGLASAIHVSGPLAMVVAGLIVGNGLIKHEKENEASDQFSAFWEMLDEILNAILFVMIGLEVIAISLDDNYGLTIGLLAIPAVLLARLISVSIPMVFIKKGVNEKASKTISVLTWGGLRGGISIALALSLPMSEYRNLVLLITYMVVVFSIVVQGLSIGTLVKKLKLSKA
ncbi:MAG: sodium:proton antiporter [Bacteroidota bacterium]